MKITYGTTEVKKLIISNVNKDYTQYVFDSKDNGYEQNGNVYPAIGMIMNEAFITISFRVNNKSETLQEDILPTSQYKIEVQYFSKSEETKGVEQ